MCVPVRVGVCAAFFSRRASRNGRKGRKVTFFDDVENESAIIIIIYLFIFLFARVTVSPEVKFLFLFYNDRAIYWACAGKNI